MSLETDERETLLLVLRSHPNWSLAELAQFAGGKTKAGKLLARVRARDLWAAIDPEALAVAERLHGPAFDACVLTVIRQARTSVGASYLRARVGGPRWKLQDALGRLVRAGSIKRTGITGTTRYTALRPRIS